MSRSHRPEPVEAEPARLEAVRAALAAARPLLPSQPPLRVFIALNTLAAFQHLPFHDAVAKAREVLGGEPYLGEERFRSLLSTGRIAGEDLADALRATYGDGPFEPLFDGVLDEGGLRELLLRHAVLDETPVSLEWLLHERRVLERLRGDVPPAARSRLLERTLPWLARKLESAAGDVSPLVDAMVARDLLGDRRQALADLLETDATHAELAAALRQRPEQCALLALWAACQDMAASLASSAQPNSSEHFPLHREVVREATGEDVFDRVFPALIRVSAAYLDDGLARAAMPERHLGFYGCVRNLVADGSVLPIRWMEAARREFGAQRVRGDGAEQVVAAALERLGVSVEDTPEYVTRVLLTLPGWAGMMARLEEQPQERTDPDARPSLVDFLAVRLTYELSALSSVPGFDEATLRARFQEARERARKPPLPPTSEPGPRAYRLLQIFQLAGITPAEVRSLPLAAAQRMLLAVERFDQLARRRVFQEAYERHFRVEMLDALAAHRATVDFAPPKDRPRFQFITCFDDREESLRRHLEELEPRIQTFGAPGFFGAAMRFRGLDMRSHVPLAPVVITPEHQIEELPMDDHARALHDQRVRRRSLIAGLNDRARLGTRSLVRGMLLNMTLGLLALFPLVLRIASPRAAGRIRSFAARVFLPNPPTDLTMHREEASDGPKRGFKVDERVARVATVFENIGLTKQFAPLIAILGHGATTLNNPHASAYDCGACSGRKGGPNARVVARMANDPEVRAGLRQVGIQIPDDTVFVGGQHDTCNEDVVFFDVQRIPESHRGFFDELKLLMRRARAREAHERCRRMVQFSAPRSPSAFEALRHVQARAEHLAEPRPELSHQGVAAAIIGRRALTRGLFLDRRAFVIAYDPTIDPSGSILERSIAAAAPVGAGIALQYYFSAVDPERYGAGSKLPHNVVGLLGVMTGHASDLRTGLPRQMIEVHEPQRLLLVVEATPERLLQIAARKPEVRELVVNRWVQLVSLDPDDGRMQLFTEQGFVDYVPNPVTLPTAESSRSFYRGKEGPLPPARIVPSGARAA